MKTPRPAVFVLLLALWPTVACASWTLDFEVSGYCVEMEVGDDARPTLGRVRLFPPGDRTGIALRPQDVRVDTFDVGRRRLHLEHRPAGPGAPPFEVMIEGTQGVLEIGGERLPAPFDWQM